MFASKAQIRKFIDLHKQGKIGASTIAKWAMNTDLTKLPERVVDLSHEDRTTK